MKQGLFLKIVAVDIILQTLKNFHFKNFCDKIKSMKKIVGVCNQKGGTGKTTTAVNLASFLGLAGKKTLLVDMDPQANATTGVGVDKFSSKYTIYDGLTKQVLPQDIIITTNFPNLYLVPSGIALSGAEIELVEQEEREFFLKKFLDKIGEEFNFIIIDAPPSLGILTLNVLVASQSVLIPIQCEYYALEGLSQLMNTINLVKNNLNPFLEIEGVILTMADFRTNLTQEVIMEVREYFKDKAYKTIIPRNVRLGEAPSFGKPIYFYDRNCLGAKSYFKLTEEFLKEEIKGVYEDGEKIG